MWIDQCIFRYSDDELCLYRGREVTEETNFMCEAHYIITITQARYRRNAADGRARRKAS